MFRSVAEVVNTASLMVVSGDDRDLLFQKMYDFLGKVEKEKFFINPFGAYFQIIRIFHIAKEVLQSSEFSKEHVDAVGSVVSMIMTGFEDLITKSESVKLEVTLKVLEQAEWSMVSAREKISPLRFMHTIEKIIEDAFFAYLHPAGVESSGSGSETWSAETTVAENQEALQKHVFSYDASFLAAEKLEIVDLYHITPKTISRLIQKSISVCASFAETEYFSLLVEKIFIPGLSLVPAAEMHSLVSELTTLLVGKRVHDQFLFLLLKLVVQRSATSPRMFIALKILSENEHIKRYIKINEETDELLLDSMNSQNIRLQAPYDHFMSYASLIYDAFGEDPVRLGKFFARVDFSKQNAHVLSRALYKTFIGSSNNNKSAMFLEALVRGFQLDHFKFPSVAAGLEKETLAVLNYFLSRSEGEELVSAMIACEDDELPPHTFFSIPFLFFARVGLNELTHQLLWHRLMYWLGVKMQQKHPEQLCREHGFNFAPYQVLFRPLFDSLENLYRFYISNEAFSSEYQALYRLIAKKIVQAARWPGGKSLPAFIKMLVRIIRPFLEEVDKDQLALLFSVKGTLGSYDNGLEAVEHTFKGILKGKNPDQWDTSPSILKDRIFFLYCAAKFPFEEYLSWVIQANPQHASYFHEMGAQAQEFQTRLPGLEKLPEHDFKVLQNNQLIALMFATHPPRGAKNVFARIGTGQGKSLVAAVTALYHAKKGRKVLVLTCYDHLAKRDFERFEPLFSSYGIKSQLIKEKGNSGDALINYAELENYFSALYAQVKKRASNSTPDEDAFDFFKGDVLILDEADALIEDCSSFDNKVKDHSRLLALPHIDRESLKTAKSFRERLSEEESLAIFFEALKRHKLLPFYKTWFSKVQADDRPGSDVPSTDDMGRWVARTVGGFRYELEKNQECYFRSIFTSALAFLTTMFSYTIGFSGTIDQKTVDRYGKIYPAAEFCVLPPFHAPLESTKNTEIVDLLSSNLTEQAWKERIRLDVEQSMGREQSTLVFGNVDNTAEWEVLKQLLEGLAAGKGISLRIINRESEVFQKNLQRACEPGALTLASHVVGRGADFKLPVTTISNGGMHVLITYAPEKGEKLNFRMITQMKGRAARSDDPGSYSIIVQHGKSVEDLTNPPVRVEDDVLRYYHLIWRIYNQLSALPHSINQWRQWFMFNWIAQNLSTFPSEFQSLSDTAALGGSSDQISRSLLEKIFLVDRPADEAEAEAEDTYETDSFVEESIGNSPVDVSDNPSMSPAPDIADEKTEEAQDSEEAKLDDPSQSSLSVSDLRSQSVFPMPNKQLDELGSWIQAAGHGRVSRESVWNRAGHVSGFGVSRR